MISLADARSAVLASLAPLAEIEVALDDALGLVLVGEVYAAESVPGFVSSAMDGYALLAADSARPPTRLAVVGTTMAGDPPWLPISSGETVRIMTGAPLPEGADAVCMLEDSEPAPDARSVVLHRSATPGEHVRRPGEDVKAGELLFSAGTFLTPRHLGVLASVGMASLAVRPRPRVGVLSTGNELRPPGVALGPGQIRESNRHMLLALLRESGVEPVDLGLVGDNEAEVCSAVAAGSKRCDLVLTSGGVSVGDRDVVRSVLPVLCPERSGVLKVAIKPAKPLVYGTLASGGILVGLPGNPVSSLVSFECFVRPVLAVLSGEPEPVKALLRAVAAEDFSRRPDGKLHLVGGSISVLDDGRLSVRRVAGTGSHMLRSVAEADVLVHLGDGQGVPAGTILDVQPIGSAAGFASRAVPLPGAMTKGDRDDGCC